MADRFGFSKVELHRVPNLELDPMQSTLVALFMFFIGNTDFSLIQGPTGEECCHNSKMLQSPAGAYYNIPYDFDASGYVNTNYAPRPDRRFNLRNNRSRLYRGFCVDRAVFDEALATFQNSRERIMEIVSNTSNVSERTANRNVQYANDFWEILDDPGKLESAILQRCRG
jgi:hypothetical protein